MASTPRPSKRMRTDPPEPHNDALQLAPTASAGSADVPNQTSRVDKGKQKQLEPQLQAENERNNNDDEESDAQSHLEEMERIYDMLAEDYHDIVAELPIEYQRTFLLIRDLEDQQIARTKDFKAALQDCLALTQAQPDRNAPTTESASSSAAPSPAPSTSTTTTERGVVLLSRIGSLGRDKMLKVAEMATAAVRAGEDKIGLAITLYDAVDRHIQRLDADLARYEDSLVIGLRDGTLPSHDAPSAMRKSPPGPTTSLGAIALGEKDAYDDPAAAAAASSTGAATGKGGGRMTTGSPHSAAAAAARTTRKKPARSAQDLEKEREWKRRKELVREERQRKKRQDLEASGMPVDPNEPVYCYCNRVSFGEMIACENEDCAREWFHLECVGLDKAPEGTWYCDDCIADLKDRKSVV